MMKKIIRSHRSFILFFVFSFFLNSFAFANHLTLYFVPSPFGMNWSTPQSLSVSTVKNSLVPFKNTFPIGHVLIEYSCPRQGVHEFTGMNAVGSEGQNRVLKQHWGLGTMVSTTKGYLQSNEEVKASLAQLHKLGTVSFLKVLMNDQACERVVEYMKEYRNQKLGDAYGGLHSRPLYREGSGCSAFGASFLEVAGLKLEQQEKSWTRTLGVPYQFIGGPRTGKKVKLVSLLTAFRSKWLSPYDPKALGIHFYDPELMDQWVKKEFKKIRLGKQKYDFPTDTSIRKLSRGVIFDMTGFETPAGSIFKN